jgi:cytochrome c553
MRTHGAILASTLSLLTLASPAAAQRADTSPAHQILNAKCTRCHSADRVYKADPAQIPGIVDRMEQKNPEFFRDTDKAALVESLSKILNDPNVAASRAAWDETVAKGKAVFNDATLGTTGKSCASCHQPEVFTGIAEKYPALDTKLGRLISLQERLRTMIETKLGGQQLPLGDPRTVALEAYLKSLR